MGRSLTATVAYGACLDPDGDKQWPWNDPDYPDFNAAGDFEEWLYFKAGIEPLDYSDHPGYPDWNATAEEKAELARKKKEWDAKVGREEYYERMRIARDECPFECDFAGTEDYQMQVLILKGTKVAEGYYGPQSFKAADLEIDSGKLLEAKRWVKENGLEWSPEWIVYPGLM